MQLACGARRVALFGLLRVLTLAYCRHQLEADFAQQLGELVRLLPVHVKGDRRAELPRRASPSLERHWAMMNGVRFVAVLVRRRDTQ
jgi:hypothetical protein